MRRKIKLKAVTSLMNLNFNDVARYVMDLHSKIKKQKKQINRLKLKVKKIVSCQKILITLPAFLTSHHLQTFLSKLDAHIAKTASPPEDRKADKKNSKSNSRPQEAAAKPEENVLDFVNEIKAQATINSFQQAGFIYEVRGQVSTASQTNKLPFSQRRDFITTPSRLITIRRNTICITTETMGAGTASTPAPTNSYFILERRPVKQSKR